MSSEGRRGGRGTRRAARLTAAAAQLPALKRRIPLYEVLDAEALERVHRASLKILQEVGIDFRDPESLSIWREQGADIEGERVRLAPELVMRLVATTPSTFTLNARNPERSVEVGGDSTVFATTYGSPFVRMLDGERRYGTLDDLHVFHKLAYTAPAIHVTGAVTCEPTDIPIPKRHLHITKSAFLHSDKPIMGPVTAPERAADAVKMAEIVFGAEFVAKNPVMTAIINANTPLVWDETMLGALKIYARAWQPAILAPFTMAGANTPASATATVAELNAEALAGLAFAQAVNPGCPMIYGNFLATVSMRSGAPMAGTSETALMNLMIGQLARKYGVPWRSSGMITGSKVTDAQAGYESAFNMLPILLAGCNYVMHSAGWTEAGLTASLPKFMIDAEQMAMLYKLGQGPRFDDFDEAVATVGDVGPGGHFLGTDHTQAHFKDAFFTADLADNNSFEQWQAEGAKDMTTRGVEAARRAIDAYEPPPIDPGIVEALDAYVREREAVLPEGLE